MWRPCRGSPSRAKLVPGLHIKGLSNKSPDRCRRRGFTVLPPTGGIINSLPLKGKRLTTFCASLTLLQNVFAVHRKAAIHNPQRQSRCRTLSEANTTLLHNLQRSRAPFLQNLRRQPPPQPSEPCEPFEPSHRRCVQWVRSKSDCRRLAVRTAMEHLIGALPRTSFPASRDFPSRGNEKYGEEKQRVIYFMYHSAASPLWW